MHSTIFAVSTFKGEKVSFDEIIENMPSAMDYVSKLEQVAKFNRLETFVNDLHKNGVVTQYFTEEFNAIMERQYEVCLMFTKHCCQAHFKDAYDRFAELVKDITLEDFCSQSTVSMLECLINDRFGYYVYYDGNMYTFDEFMRESQLVGLTLYVNDVFDYHA